MRTLVVGPVVRYLLGAGAQAGHGYDNTNFRDDRTLTDLTGQRHLIVEQTLNSSNRGFLLQKKRKTHLDMPFVGIEVLDHLM